MITFIVNVFFSFILTVIVSFASNVILEAGPAWMTVIFLVWLTIWPKVKMFANKKRPEQQKVRRSFSDAVCSVLGMVSVWADKKHKSMSEKPAISDNQKGRNLKEEKIATPVEQEEKPSMNEKDMVRETIKEVEEELKEEKQEADPEEELEDFQD